MLALAALGLVWFSIQRYFKKVDVRFDKQDLKLDEFDVKLDSIIEKQGKHEKKIFVHTMILKRIDPHYIVNYDD